MLEYIEILGLPASIAICLVAIFFVMQLIGEVLELKGKVVPEFMHLKKYFARRKQEQETLAKMPQALANVNRFLAEVQQRYSDDNIAVRDTWMKTVDERGIENKKDIKDIKEILDKHSEYILSLIIENKRNTIIEFASRVANSEGYFTREQFNRVFKIYAEYEDIIEKQGMTNGEVDVAYRIIEEAYMDCLKDNRFIEDMRGYC